MMKPSFLLAVAYCAVAVADQESTVIVAAGENGLCFDPYSSLLATRTLLAIARTARGEASQANQII